MQTYIDTIATYIARGDINAAFCVLRDLKSKGMLAEYALLVRQDMSLLENCIDCIV
jgi:hypothetical protein